MNMYAERTEKTASEKDKTGIPRKMKTSFEHSSGFSFDDVRVHYNSEKPAQLRAHAYTQGNEVYVAPGQEKHLPHELGHVVQQKGDTVKPTGEIGGLPLNDDEAMENGADMIAENAENVEDLGEAPVQAKFKGDGVVQRNAVETQESYNAWAGFGSTFVGMLGVAGGIGSFLYTKHSERKHRYIEEIEKYSDAACDAYEDLLAVQLPENAQADDNLPSEAKKLKSKIERNYNAAMDKAVACGAFDKKRWYEEAYSGVTSLFRKTHPKLNDGVQGAQGPDTREVAMIKNVEDLNIRNALLRARKAYDDSTAIAINVNNDNNDEHDNEGNDQQQQQPPPQP